MSSIKPMDQFVIVAFGSEPMSAMTFVAIILAWIAVLITGAIAYRMLRNPRGTLPELTHHLDQLPEVMTGRYASLCLFSLFAALYQDLAVIAFWGATLAFLGFVDAYIYKKAGKDPKKHLVAGGLAAVIALTAYVAMI